MAAVRHLGFVWGIFGPPTKGTWVFITVQILVAINAVVSKIWKFEVFARLAWKRLFAPPKSGFQGNLTPLMDSNIKRKNPPTGLTC